MQKRTIFLILYVPLVAFAQTQVTTKLLQEMGTASDGQKFYEIGGCYAALSKGTQTGNAVLINRAKKTMDIVDLDMLKNRAVTLATNACPDKSDNCIFSKAPKGAAGFIAGLSKGNNTLNPNNVDEIVKWQDSLCTKYF